MVSHFLISFRIGAGVGALIGGVCADKFGHPATFGVAAISKSTERESLYEKFFLMFFLRPAATNIVKTTKNATIAGLWGV